MRGPIGTTLPTRAAPPTCLAAPALAPLNSQQALVNVNACVNAVVLGKGRCVSSGGKTSGRKRL